MDESNPVKIGSLKYSFSFPVSDEMMRDITGPTATEIAVEVATRHERELLAEMGVRICIDCGGLDGAHTVAHRYRLDMEIYDLNTCPATMQDPTDHEGLSEGFRCDRPRGHSGDHVAKLIWNDSV